MKKCARKGCKEEAKVVPVIHFGEAESPMVMNVPHCGPCSLLAKPEDLIQDQVIDKLRDLIKKSGGNPDMLDRKTCKLRFISLDHPMVKFLESDFKEPAAMLKGVGELFKSSGRNDPVADALEMLLAVPPENLPVARLTLARIIVGFIVGKPVDVDEFALNVVYRVKGDSNVQTAHMMQLERQTVGSASNAYAMLAAIAQHLGTLQIIQAVGGKHLQTSLAAFYAAIQHNVDHLREENK